MNLLAIGNKKIEHWVINGKRFAYFFGDRLKIINFPTVWKETVVVRGLVNILS